MGAFGVRSQLTRVKVFDQTFFKKFVGFGMKPQGLVLQHLRSVFLEVNCRAATRGNFLQEKKFPGNRKQPALGSFLFALQRQSETGGLVCRLGRFAACLPLADTHPPPDEGRWFRFPGDAFCKRKSVPSWCLAPIHPWQKCASQVLRSRSRPWDVVPHPTRGLTPLDRAICCGYAKTVKASRRMQ